MFLTATIIAVPKTAEASYLVKFGNNITVEEGITISNAVAIGGQVTVYGRVENHVIAVGGSVVLGSTAIVGGNVISLGGIVVRGKGAEVGGSITEINRPRIKDMIESVISGDRDVWSWIYAVLSIFVFFGLLVCELLIAAFIPQNIRHVSTAIREDTLKVTLWGILGLAMIAPLAVLLTISIIGIALIPLEMLFVACAVLVGLTSVSQLVGSSLFQLMNKSERGIVGETFWGLIILWIMGWFPYIGVMIKVFSVIVGLGAVLTTRFGTRQKLPSHSEAPL